MTGAMPLEYVDCPLCQSSRSRLRYQEGPWQVVRCRDCGHLYTNPRPTAEDLAAFYTADYFADAARFPNQSHDVAEAPGRAADIEHYVERRGTLLEAGAATGQFLASMRKRGWQVAGVELSAEAAREARERHGLDVLCGRLEDYPPDRSFDVVCMFQTLEHLMDPVAVVGACYQRLRPDGILVVEVPHADCFDLRLSARQRQVSFEPPRHLNHFTPTTLARLLRRTGFEIVDLDRYPSQWLLKALAPLRRLRPGASTEAATAAPATAGSEKPEPPLMRKPQTWAARMERGLAVVFSGWRFTIVGRKAGARR